MTLVNILSSHLRGTTLSTGLKGFQKSAVSLQTCTHPAPKPTLIGLLREEHRMFIDVFLKISKKVEALKESGLVLLDTKQGNVS